MIRVIMASECRPYVKMCPVRLNVREIEVVALNKLLHIGRTHMRLLFSESVHKIKIVYTLLIRHNHIHIVRNLLGNPVMPAYGLKPPYLIHILKGYSVHLIGSVLLKKASEPLNALSCGLYVRKNNVDNVLLADTARNLLFSVSGRLIHDKRIRP